MLACSLVDICRMTSDHNQQDQRRNDELIGQWRTIAKDATVSFTSSLQ